jgi:hypothetical protein
VNPGDSMTASVSVSAHIWTFKLVNGTENWSYTTSVTWSASPPWKALSP